MAVDLSVFDRLKTKEDYDQAEAEFQLKRALVQQKLSQTASGGDLPATIQVANEIQKALKAGDFERANLLQQVHKTFDRGINPYGANPVASGQMTNAGQINSASAMPDIGGNITEAQLAEALATAPAVSGGSPLKVPVSPTPIPGYGSAVGSIAATKKGMERSAEKNVDLDMNPKIERATNYEGERGTADAKFTEGYGTASTDAEYTQRLINEALNAPGFDANFGLSGRVINRPGSDASDAASKIDQVNSRAFLAAFERLRGAGAITEKEGDAATTAITRLNNKDQSPREARKAGEELLGIIQDGARRSRDRAARLGLPGSSEPPITVPDKPVAPAAPARGSVVGGYMYDGGDPAKQSSWKKVK